LKVVLYEFCKNDCLHPTLNHFIKADKKVKDRVFKHINCKYFEISVYEKNITFDAVFRTKLYLSVNLLKYYENFLLQ
jgi:hypothetical protein